MVRRPGIALVVSGACCAAASDAEAERARIGTDDETDRWGAVEAAAATTALRAAASMVGTGFQVFLGALFSLFFRAFSAFSFLPC